MLSIETVPASGHAGGRRRARRPVRQPAPHAVAVADRDRGEPGVARGDEAPPVARALPGARALDLGDVGDELQRRHEPVLGRVALERVHAVDRDRRSGRCPAAPRAPRASRPSSRRAGSRRDAPRSASAHGRKRASCSRMNAGSSSAVAKCVIAPASRSRGAAADRVGDARRLVRVARPEPAHAGVELDVHADPAASARRARATNASRQATTSARARQRDAELLGRERAHDEQRAADARGAQLRPPRPPSPPRATPPRRPARRARPGTAPCP